LQIGGLIFVSFIPGLFWLWFFTRLDRVQPAPKRLILLSFLLGMVATIPAGIINTIALDESQFDAGATLTAVAVSMLVVVGPVEETSKFLAVRFGAFRSAYFDEPVDGLVYSAAASLGFASLENLLYVFSFGPEVMLFRAPLSTVAHLVFGSLWGLGLGLQARPGGRSRLLLITTLVAAAALHASFNIALFSPYPLLSILIVIVGGIWTYRRFEWGQRISPFRYRRNYPQFACDNCQGLVRVTATFCPHCGVGTLRVGRPIVCGNCHHENRPDALYCIHCGDRFLLEAQEAHERPHHRDQQ
jgi:RsiW-degrading membrane proteinase PrsW (M82 family)